MSDKPKPCAKCGSLAWMKDPDLFCPCGIADRARVYELVFLAALQMDGNHLKDSDCLLELRSVAETLITERDKFAKPKP
jgi:hypothetical protein